MIEHLHNRYPDMSLKVFKEWQSKQGEMGLYGFLPHGPLLVAVHNENGSEDYSFVEPFKFEITVKQLEVIAQFAGAKEVQ